MQSISKNFDIGYAKQVIKEVKEIGFRVRTSFIFDLPTTTKEDMQKTINFIFIFFFMIMLLIFCILFLLTVALSSKNIIFFVLYFFIKDSISFITFSALFPLQLPQ